MRPSLNWLPVLSSIPKPGGAQQTRDSRRQDGSAGDQPGIPCDRAPLGIEVMQHGQDYRRQAALRRSISSARRQSASPDGRIYSICFERFEVEPRQSSELVASAVGKVVQTVR
jgi:hypothetical protein